MQWIHSDAQGDLALADGCQLRVFEIAGIGWTGSVRLAPLPKDTKASRPKEWPTKPHATKEAAQRATLELFEDLKARSDNETVEPVRPAWRKRGKYQKRTLIMNVSPAPELDINKRKMSALGKRAYAVVFAARAIAANTANHDEPIGTPELRIASRLGRSAFFEGMQEARTAGFIFDAGRGRCFVKPPLVASTFRRRTYKKARTAR